MQNKSYLDHLDFLYKKIFKNKNNFLSYKNLNIQINNFIFNIINIINNNSKFLYLKKIIIYLYN
jgi:hypothetical protein